MPKDSVFHYYRQLIALRKQYDIFIKGKFCLILPEDENIFAYTRTWGGQTLTVIANFGESIKTFHMEEMAEKMGENARLLLTNGRDIQSGILGSYEARMYISG